MDTKQNNQSKNHFILKASLITLLIGIFAFAQVYIVMAINQMDNRITRLEDRMDTRLTEVDTRMNNRLTEMDTRMNDRLTEMENRSDERLRKIEERLDKLNQNYIDHLERHLSER